MVVPVESSEVRHACMQVVVESGFQNTHSGHNSACDQVLLNFDAESMFEGYVEGTADLDVFPNLKTNIITSSCWIADLSS